MNIALLGIPFDDNASFARGAALAPQIIRKTLANGSLNTSCENGQDLNSNPRWMDYGNINVDNPNQYASVIETNVSGLLAEHTRLLTLGGDHSITLPILSAYHKVYDQLTILHFDAHADLYDSFKGNRHTNASPFARIMEQGLCKRLIQVGVRTLNRHQREQAKRFGVEIIEMKDFQPNCLPTIDGPVYLSLDIDAIDPAFAPGVSHREPGGLTSREVINLIHQINAPIVGADIVEYNPNCDLGELTAQLAAKLVKEVAGKMLAAVS